MGYELVSVVIPTYNYGHFVTEAVDSVLAQTYQNFEIIVVDDGSRDDTRQRLAKYGDRIRYIYQENQGLPAARNTAILAAKGTLVALLDSDDLWHPRKLEVQMAYLGRHPEVGMLASHHVSDLRDGWPEVDAAAQEAEPVTLNDLFIRSRFGSCGVVVRKECFAQVGLFDTELRSAEDRDMWIRIARRFAIVKQRAALWLYREHGASMSNAVLRMEQYELRVLRKAFRAGPPPLSVKMRALSHAAFGAAYMYSLAGMRARGVARMVKSFLLWPLPYRRDEVRTRLERPKRLAWIVFNAGRPPSPSAAPREPAAAAPTA